MPSGTKQNAVNKFEVTILGCGSAKPTTRHFPTSQIVNVRDKLFLIDCGEGCQAQICRAHLSYNKIRCIFISHLHGDHVLGLIGLVSTMGLNDRTADLHIYAPCEFENMFASMKNFFCADSGFEVFFHGVDTMQAQVVFEDRSVSVSTIPLHHRVACCGYLFREKEGLPHIRREMIDALNIPYSQINNIKGGADWVMDDGTIIPHSRLTIPADASRSYAYCSDTAYMPHLASQIRGVNLLYHEATYGEDRAEMAKEYFHSTAKQAAQVARDAEVGKLLIGHYSARYLDENVLLEEAKTIFPNTILSQEFLTIGV